MPLPQVRPQAALFSQQRAPASVDTASPAAVLSRQVPGRSGGQAWSRGGSVALEGGRHVPEDRKPAGPPADTDAVPTMVYPVLASESDDLSMSQDLLLSLQK